jgi:V8-like Glu-specific endopeptidase
VSNLAIRNTYILRVNTHGLGAQSKSMQAKKIMLAATLSLILAATLTTIPAYALTGNIYPDSTHSFVGLVVFYSLDANGNKIPVSISSGILLSPTILLTTAHSCVTETVMVCFDKGPITWSINNGQLQIQGVTAAFEGTAYPHPEFQISQKNTGLPDAIHNDLAVIVLQEPVPLSVVDTYAQLPTAGLVDTLRAKTDVTLVGYGFELSSGVIMRNYAFAKTVSGNFAWSDEFIRCSANSGNGRGGINSGDSGGPVLLGSTNVAIALHSYTVNANCQGVSYHARLDLPQVLDWIREVSQFD